MTTLTVDLEYSARGKNVSCLLKTKDGYQAIK